RHFLGSKWFWIGFVELKHSTRECPALVYFYVPRSILSRKSFHRFFDFRRRRRVHHVRNSARWAASDARVMSRRRRISSFSPDEICGSRRQWSKRSTISISSLIVPSRACNDFNRRHTAS